MSVVLVLTDDNLEESAKLLNNYEENKDFGVNTWRRIMKTTKAEGDPSVGRTHF